MKSLEQNVLKLRAFEMILILFYIEDMKECIVSCIRATDSLHSTSRLPQGVKNLYKKAWSIAVSDGVITSDDKAHIEDYTDYRNIIGHSIYDLTCDVNADPYSKSDFNYGSNAYDSAALKRIQYLNEKIWTNVGKHYVVELSIRNLLFEKAIKAYELEITRLRNKISKLFAKRKREIETVNRELKACPKEVWESLQPSHPRNRKDNGSLSRLGTDCCYSLFEMGLGDLTISHAMGLSLRAVKARRKMWLS